MKKSILFGIGLLASVVAGAQESSSISVWEGDSVTGTYNLYNIDSLYVYIRY